ncbi:MAG: type II toxin-antitoxin system RelE/ParE family toxin [Hyphomicrobiales bacterium]|nr:type II toxin-antitoxin system RelE/ParE family toxin [Hyphomicrobiales bacterium]
MADVRQTATFREWHRNLRDRRAAARIASRIERLEIDHVGDVKSVGDGVSELRVDHGPGYRIYFARRGPTVYVLLCGGDKSTQARDIKAAKLLAKEI